MQKYNKGKRERIIKKETRMSIGAAYYAYRNNFNCKQGSTKRPFRRNTKIRLVDLFRDNFRFISKYDDDYFISLCQWIMKKGYPIKLSLSDDTWRIDKYYQEALFSVDPFHAQNLWVNHNHFNLKEWRRQFELFEESYIEGLNYYRNRASIPILAFSTFDEIKEILFTEKGKNGEINNKLFFSANSYHKDAIWILSKEMIIHREHFVYRISYGCKDDYEEMKNHKYYYSSWEIEIRSEDNENYIDFCLRIYNAYEMILKGSKKVLSPEEGLSSNRFILKKKGI